MFTKLFNEISFEVQTKTLPRKGNLVYEYNPFRNYRISLNMYEYKELLYSLGELWNIFKISINCKATRTLENNIYTYKIVNEFPDDIDDNLKADGAIEFGNWIEEAYKKGKNADRVNLERALMVAKLKDAWYNVPSTETDPYLREPGELVDFITDELNFSIDHPVHLIPQYSYDGSVDLIINDGINVPKLINSRFSATGKNTYEIIDRKGNSDTNIYDLGIQFNTDTSLYKIVSKIPKINFKGVFSGGNLKVGNYHFYFKFSDADDNETDFIGESGLVSIFIGFSDHFSVHTGLKNENSNKLVQFLLSNIDTSYSYVYVYYSRASAEGEENFLTLYIKIDKKFTINNFAVSNIFITGNEPTITLNSSDINLNYNLVDAANTSAICLNMLFLGNVHEPDIPYTELSDLSLRFLPYLKEERSYIDIDLNYRISSKNKGYIDPLFIYNKTGYWGNEIYRFGIVYILPNGELSPVFNIRGRLNVGSYNAGLYTDVPLYDNINNRKYIEYDEESYKLKSSTIKYENVKGVVSFAPTLDADTIYSIDIRVDNETISELKKYVKGFFFVRLPRIPTVLALGITIGIDKESGTPTIPTAGGILNGITLSLVYTHVDTDNINGVNFISEGFLHRYSFKFEKKHSGLFGSIFKGILVGIGVVALAAGVIFTGGALTAPAAGIAGAVSAGVSAVGSTIVASGTILTGVASTIGVAGTVAAVGVGAGLVVGAGLAIAGGILEIRYGILRLPLHGREIETPDGYKKVETDDSRQIVQDFKKRIIIKDPSSNYVSGILCPDYELNLSLYNLLFSGNEHYIESTIAQNFNFNNIEYEIGYFTSDDRHFYIPSYVDINLSRSLISKIIPVSDDVSCVGIDDMIFRSRAGLAEEAWRYLSILKDYKHDSGAARINSDIVRGSFGPYLAFNDTSNYFSPAETVNIYVPGYSVSNMNLYFLIRMHDSSTYSAITDRYDILDIGEGSNLVGEAINQYLFSAYRGDCYICQFTHRVIRNFNDPSAPYNDEIVDPWTWKNNYDPNNTEKYQLINLGDVNAVELGMWVTFKVRSSNNLNIRTLDASNIDEVSMCGGPRGYYPQLPMSVEGTYKRPESQVYNKGFSKSLGERWNFEVPDVPYIKNWFGTRVMYSDIHISDAYRNGFRVFLGNHYRDYTREYGEIVKLISLDSNLLCVFEHGVALIPVNERAVAGEGAGGNVYINTSNVLPENPKIISDMFGSQWPESVLKVPGKTGDSKLYVYGVDTIAKKIWRTDGLTLVCISDFRVQEFLNNNITLGERELTPKIGIRNVKTVYNAFKRDVLFTFYDNTYGFEEKVWNLCWNELLQKFITFYSWVPSYMENINNIPFSFDRNTSKWIALLGTSHTESSFADGITLSNVIINNTLESKVVDNFSARIPYTTIDGDISYIDYEVPEDERENFIGILQLSNRTLPDLNLFYLVKYTLERDSYLNYNKFEIKQVTPATIENGKYKGKKILLYALYFKSNEDDLKNVYILDQNTYNEVNDGVYPIYTLQAQNTPDSIVSELYYRNKANHVYADYDVHKLSTKDLNIEDYVPPINISEEEALNWDAVHIKGTNKEQAMKSVRGLQEKLAEMGIEDPLVGNSAYQIVKVGGKDCYVPKWNPYPCTTLNKFISEIDDTNHIHNIQILEHWVITAIESTSGSRKVHLDLPIFKDITGKRPMLPKEEQINSDKIVTLLNIKASILIEDIDNKSSLSDAYYNMKAGYNSKTSLIDMGYYQSVVAVAPKWNLQFLTSDFWKHGQAGIIDIADDIYPTYWYGKLHPFEFEFIVVNDPSVHKIFTNLEIVANKAKPESFHYEIVGESYDFAKDKVNMYFRQEAMKALWQYNGADISYDRNFLKVQPKLLNKSADFPHRYYTRQDTINDVEDYYIHVSYPNGYDYRHLSGAEIVYYPNRQEFRVLNHAMAVDLDDPKLEGSRSIIAANCKYLEDRWKVTINPITIVYKNEYLQKGSGNLFSDINSTWPYALGNYLKLPSLPIYNSPIPDKVLESGNIDFPGNDLEHPEWGEDNALYNLYDLSNYNQKGGWKPLDLTNWLNDVNIYKYNFGEAQNRKEIDIKDKFLKVRIRYSGEELAIIDFVKTIYRVSYS